jgi:hypothetical protein
LRQILIEPITNLKEVRLNDFTLQLAEINLDLLILTTIGDFEYSIKGGGPLINDLRKSYNLALERLCPLWPFC